jgi:hypothetical protein
MLGDAVAVNSERRTQNAAVLDVVHNPPYGVDRHRESDPGLPPLVVTIDVLMPIISPAVFSKGPPDCLD